MASLQPADAVLVDDLRGRIAHGQDPLGDAFCRIRNAAIRRRHGATYTPLPFVKAMLHAIKHLGQPARVIDPGCGSGRFLIEAARTYPHAQLVGVDVDPVATIVARANLAAVGVASRAEIRRADYRDMTVESLPGPTAYVGNPPYVRHHQIEPAWKLWLVSSARKLGLDASQLAGLHAYFYLATALQARPGDFGSFVTSAEWLDVNYGKLIRKLFVEHLGGTDLTVVEPTALPFPDAATTAAISIFQIGTVAPAVRLARVDAPDRIGGGHPSNSVGRERLRSEARWSHLTRRARAAPSGYVELGELCRVHRGTVTGANGIWISGPHSDGLPLSVLYPSVTRAREILDAGPVLADSGRLRRVIDIPGDLDLLARADRQAVEEFLRKARALGADQGYIARNRKAWWSVGLRDPAPILATYMARRPPAFVRNVASARHINIAHGLYPRCALSEGALRRLITHLSAHTDVADGRTYAGGLTKFEPREMERLLVPTPDTLETATC